MQSRRSFSFLVKMTFSPSSANLASSRRWIVEASFPVISVMRLAARPVGAVSNVLSPSSSYMARMARREVVLPVPGPPVMTTI